MRQSADIMADLIATGLTAQQIMLMAELSTAAAVEAVKAPAETPEERKKRVSRETSQRHRASLRVTDASPEAEAESVTPRHQVSPDVTPVSPPRERVLDKPLTKVLTGSVVVVDEARAGAPNDWPADKLAHRLTEAVESPFLDPNKSPGLITSGRVLASWRAAGASWEHDVIPIVSALAAKNRKPINSWAYFEAAVLQSAADSRRALSLPQASPQTGPRQANERLPDQRQAARLDNYRAAFAGAEQASRNRAFSGWRPSGGNQQPGSDR